MSASDFFFWVVVRGANSSVKSARRRWSGNGAVSSSKFSNYSSEYESFPSSWRRNGRVQVGLDIHDSTDLEALNISSVGKPIQSCTMRCSASISVRESSTDFSLHSWHPYHSTFFFCFIFFNCIILEWNFVKGEKREEIEINVPTIKEFEWNNVPPQTWTRKWFSHSIWLEKWREMWFSP